MPRTTAARDPDGSVSGVPDVGAQIREERERQAIGLRELSKRVRVSPSLISQIETGKSRPSVSTLYSIVSELGMSLDGLFGDIATKRQPRDESSQDGQPPKEPERSLDRNSPVVRHDDRLVLQLNTGVMWERLTASPERDIDFLMVTYEVGSASCEPNQLMRHAGNEYGVVLEGRLSVRVGFDEYVLDRGDSIRFASSNPHRLSNVGSVPVRAIWVVIGRNS